MLCTFFCLCHLLVIFCIYIYENFVKSVTFLRVQHTYSGTALQMDTVMCSLGHGLRTFTAVPTSGGRYIDRVPASAGVRTGMLPLSGGR